MISLNFALKYAGVAETQAADRNSQAAHAQRLKRMARKMREQRLAAPSNVAGS
jgi:hypothetical protein